MPVKNKLIGTKVIEYAKYAVFLTNILAIILLLMSVLSWTISPSKLTFISYLGLGFPILLFINFGYLVFWIVFLRWRFVLVQLIALTLCWDPMLATFPMHLKSKEVPQKSIKVLSYNVRNFSWLTKSEARKNPIFDYIIRSEADIICFQEFFVSSQKEGNSIISEAEFNQIMKDYPYHAFVKLGNKNALNSHGLACYSKFPILKSMKVPFESIYNGSAIHEIDINGRIVTLVNNHLESNRLTSKDKKLYKDFFRTRDRESFEEMSASLQNKLGTAYYIREGQVDMIRKYIDNQKTKSTIVCGDFNDTPLSYAYKTMKGDLIDSFAESGFGYGFTYHENLFLVRIDYIMHSSDIESYNCSVDKVKYSDHYPISTYLHFK